MPERVFISHSTEDRDFVEREIIPLLESHGIDTWYSKDDIRTGTQWDEQIANGLESCDWFMVVLSPRSMDSRWVKNEFRWAVEERPDEIVPVIIESCEWKKFHVWLRGYQCVDFSLDSQNARQSLLNTWGIEYRGQQADQSPTTTPPSQPSSTESASAKTSEQSHRRRSTEPHQPDEQQAGRIDVECPNGHQLEVKESLLGKHIKCPACSVGFVVPEQLDATWELTAGMSAKGEVDADVAEARRLLPEAVKKEPLLQEKRFDRMLDLLERQAAQAFQKKDADTWSRTARRIREIKNTIEQAVLDQPQISLDELPDPSVLAMLVEAKIREQEQAIAAGQYLGSETRAKAQLSHARSCLAQVNLSMGNASKQEIQAIFSQLVQPIEEGRGASPEYGIQELCNRLQVAVKDAKACGDSNREQRKRIMQQGEPFAIELAGIEDVPANQQMDVSDALHDFYLEFGEILNGEGDAILKETLSSGLKAAISAGYLHAMEQAAKHLINACDHEKTGLTASRLLQKVCRDVTDVSSDDDDSRKRAMQIVRKLKQVQPRSPLANVLLAKLLCHDGRDAQAHRSLKKAERLNTVAPDPETSERISKVRADLESGNVIAERHLNAAIEAGNRGADSDAMREIEAALNSQKDQNEFTPLILALKAVTHVKLTQHSLARSCYRKAVSLQARFPNPQAQSIIDVLRLHF